MRDGGGGSPWVLREVGHSNFVFPDGSRNRVCSVWPAQLAGSPGFSCHSISRYPLQCHSDKGAFEGEVARPISAAYCCPSSLAVSEVAREAADTPGPSMCGCVALKRGWRVFNGRTPPPLAIPPPSTLQDRHLAQKA